MPLLSTDSAGVDACNNRQWKFLGQYAHRARQCADGDFSFPVDIADPGTAGLQVETETFTM